MRFKAIEIEGFRAFARHVALDLDADVIVLQGANGVGKTSLLDAILWALSGSISRFADRGSPVSLYAREGRARVSLTLTGPNGDVVVTRSTDGTQNLTRLRIGSEEFEGAVADQRIGKLLLPHLEERQDARKVLGSILTRGVYLQQDLVRQFIDSDTSADRFALVSEVIGAGTILELQSALEKSRNLWSRNTTALRKDEIAPLQSRVVQIDEQIARLAEANAIQSDATRPQIEAAFEKAVTLLGRARIGMDEAPGTAALLDRFLKILGAERARLEREAATAESLIEQLGEFSSTALAAGEVVILEAAEQDLSHKISIAEQDLQTEIVRLSEDRERRVVAADRANRTATLAKLALEDLGDHCPVCEQSHDFAHTVAHLQALISAASQPSEPASEDRLGSLNATRSELQRQLEKVKGDRLDLTLAQRDRDARRALFASRLSDLGIAFGDAAKPALDARKAEAHTTLEQVARLVADAEGFSLQVLRLGEQQRREGLQSERAALTERLSVTAGRVASLEETHAVAGNIIDGLRDASLAVTRQQIDRIAPLFQRIYSRIDPHPTFRVTQLLAAMKGGRGKLDVAICDPDIDVEPQDAGPLLSSSQLNSFAVSLFLAINLALPSLKLGATILDDPLQSLDAINLLGLVDVLRRFREHRQIIVSTHEDRLMGLLQRKLRPVRPDERMITLIFDDWTREGPAMRSIETPFLDGQQSVIAA
jgi:DNA repair exonuclease SbcCD ATPase subunit